MMKKNYLCVHGHFYQPPRENPWLEIIEAQDSASPYHDWNERINRECYAPNTASRLLDEDGRIDRIVNNFEKISFNIGPTLFSWLMEADPDTYSRIVEADRASVSTRSGHGSAMAQAYNHMIMPLATDRDKETQIKWGIADFRSHFGRDPEGMWLPETAVDNKTLEIMADNGIRFTILSQSQAMEIKESSESEMKPINGGIDPTRAYKARLGGGGSIALFFYDGPISRAVAFEDLLDSGDMFAARLKDGFSKQREWDQLVHIATDGETFGHHHRFGEMALSYALNRLESSGDVLLTNYGEFLSLHPPQAEVNIHERSSWSCAHGVGRWMRDCGCSLETHKGWNQQWRAPLREALDLLKSRLDALFQEEGEKLLKDPWEARNGYIDVILDRSRRRALDFLADHQRKELSPAERITAMKLLELQRNSMLMFTSCGWFFDDISGIETIQILKYAARAIQLCEEVSDLRPEPEFLSVLEKGESNVPQQGTGADIYNKHALPEKTSIARLMANYAIPLELGSSEGPGIGAAFEVYEKDARQDEHGETSLSIRRGVVRSRITLEEETLVAATLRLGGADVNCFTMADTGIEGYSRIIQDVFEAWVQRSLMDVIRRLDDHFKGGYFTLKDLFTERRRKAITVMFADHLKRFEDTYGQLFWRNRKMMDYYVSANVPVPQEFKLAAQYILERELLKSARDTDRSDLAERLADLLGEIDKWNLSVDLEPFLRELEDHLVMMMNKISDEHDIETVQKLIKLILMTQAIGLGLDLWRIQNRFEPILKERLRAPDDPFYGSNDFKKLGILLNFSLNEQ